MVNKELKRERERAYYAANKERICARRRVIRGEHHREWSRQYIRKHRERVAEYHASYRFGVTREKIRELRAEHQACAICGGDNGGVKLVIDHDHQSGELRGLLCKTCNWGLGHFMDSPALLHKAAFYLAKHKAIGEVG